MKKTQNRIISPHAGWRLCLYVMLVMFASCKSCKKEINLLPDETQTGANTFGCLVDGKAWIPTGSGAIGSKPIVGGYRSALPPVYSNSTNVWILTSRDSERISLYARNVDRIGAYPLNFDTGPAPQELYPQNYASCSTNSGFYTTTTIHTGVVEITRADTVSSIVSGRFSFTGLDRTTNKTIQVTDGRFDCKTGL